MALKDPYPGQQPALPRQRHVDAGGRRRLDRARAPRGHPGELPRQRRGGHRHVPHRRGAGVREGPPGRRAPQDHALHPRQRRPAPAHEGGGRGPRALHHLRLLQLRQVRLLRRSAHEAGMAFRSLLDAGIKAAAGSDFSPGPPAPLMGIQGMVTRTGWDGKTWGANQRVSVDEAVQINTINGAYNAHEEHAEGLHHRGEAGRLRGAGRRPIDRGSRDHQGHRDRAHGGGRRDGLREVAALAHPRVSAFMSAGACPWAPCAGRPSALATPSSWRAPASRCGSSSRS